MMMYFSHPLESKDDPVTWQDVWSPASVQGTLTECQGFLLLLNCNLLTHA